MKKGYVLLVTFFLTFFTSWGQMRKNGKLVDIRTASKKMVMNALAGEYDNEGYRTRTSVKFDIQGNFKMVYVYDKKDQYSKLIGTTIPGDYYKRIVSGTYKLYDANYQRFNNIGNVQPKNKYGEPIDDNLNVRFYIVLTGVDDRGGSHTMCGEVTQRVDSEYIYGWTIDFTNRVQSSEISCSCETGDSKNRETTLPYIKIR
jgi:hypothetical protein